MSDSSGPELDLPTHPDLDRRARIRHQAQLETYCQPGEGTLEGFWRIGRVQDLSQIGLGLVMSRRFEPGTVLTVELQSLDQALTRTIQARVVHASAQGPNQWLLGCALEQPLTEDELRRLL